MDKKGVVFNIQRFTIHDGPGIRTELFLKGCPLSCKWCGNPESQQNNLQAGVYHTKCIGKDKCGWCENVCPEKGSLIFEDNILVSIDREKCTGCMKCAEECPADAIKQWGEIVTVSEAMDIIRRDIDYYERSGGGVTISGGEPLVQNEFVAAVFASCHEEGIHTCIESTLCTDWSVIEKAIKNADVVITDIKHMDPEVHKKYTGVSNERILENIKKLSKTEKPLIIRIPVIPGINDTMQNIEATADYIIEELGNKVIQLQLLRFMHLGEEKYKSLGIPYHMSYMDIDHEKFTGTAGYQK